MITFIKNLEITEADYFVCGTDIIEKQLFKIERSDQSTCLVEVLKKSKSYQCIGCFDLENTSLDGWALANADYRVETLKHYNWKIFSVYWNLLQNFIFCHFAIKLNLYQIIAYLSARLPSKEALFLLQNGELNQDLLLKAFKPLKIIDDSITLKKHLVNHLNQPMVPAFLFLKNILNNGNDPYLLIQMDTTNDISYQGSMLNANQQTTIRQKIILKSHENKPCVLYFHNQKDQLLIRRFYKIIFIDSQYINDIDESLHQFLKKEV